MMKKLALIFVVLVGVAVSIAATREQATIAPVLQALKLQYVLPADRRVGGPMEYRVTDETIEYLKALKDDGKSIVLQPDGSIAVK